MANCHKCWWADYNEASPTLHTITMVPDYTNMKNPLADPPKYREVKSCGKGMGYFKNFGAKDHNCPKFMDEAEGKAQLEEVSEDKRLAWNGATQRTKLSHSGNVLEYIQVMSEGNNDAFNALADLSTLGPDVFGELVFALDDMNIRGEQFLCAMEFSQHDARALIKNAQARSAKMVKYINLHNETDEEIAVENGASIYGHKELTDEAVKRANNSRPNRTGRGRVGRKHPTVKTRWGRGTDA